MRHLFPGHYPLSQDELVSFWDKAIFVFDTNTLLNMYRYTSSTRDEFLGVLEALGERVRIPFQVANEFFENRYTVIQEQARAYNHLDTLFSKTLSELKAGFQLVSRHSQINTGKLTTDVERAFNEMRQVVKTAETSHPDLITQTDVILERLTRIVEGKVRPRPTEAEMKEAEKWASARLDQGQPPGFADKKKTGDRKLGDGLIWREILDIAAEGQPLVFVTDDVKDDWWLRVSGRTIGPLPALRQEVFLVKGQAFHMFKAEQFMKHGGKFFKKEVKAEALAEAAQVRAKTYRLTFDLSPVLGKENSKARHLEELANSLETQVLTLREHLESRMKTLTPRKENHRAFFREISDQIDDLTSQLNDVSARIERQRAVDSNLPFKSLSDDPLLGDVRHRKVQEFYETEDEFHELGDPKTIALSAAEVDALEADAGTPIWLDHHNGFFALIDDEWLH
jgi:hypothetical protein